MNGNSSVFTIISIIIIGIIGYYVYKSMTAGKIAPAAEPPPEPAAETTGGPAINTEPTCPAGETCAEDNQGRFDCDESKPDSYEVLPGVVSFSGDDLTIKLYGPPHHSDGDCCSV